MDKKEANKLARKLQARFDVLFKNTFLTHGGKHWQKREPDCAADVARESISTNVEATRVRNKTIPALFAFRVTVKADDPEFVEPNLSIMAIDKELRCFLPERITLLSDTINLNRGEIFLLYFHRGSRQSYHFNFRVK